MNIISWFERYVQYGIFYIIPNEVRRQSMHNAQMGDLLFLYITNLSRRYQKLQKCPARLLPLPRQFRAI